jgi:hypothetical protein
MRPVLLVNGYECACCIGVLKVVRGGLEDKGIGTLLLPGEETHQNRVGVTYPECAFSL